MIVYDNTQKKYIIITKTNTLNYYQTIMNVKYGKNSNKQKNNIAEMIYDKIKIVY